MDRALLRSHQLRNNLHSAVLIGSLALLLAYLAWMIGGASFAWLTLVGVLLLYLLNPAGSPWLVLSLYRARPIHPHDAPRLYAILTELARRAGLEALPALHYIPTPVMTAFTTGDGDEAAMALSDGLLRRLDLREVAAVMAHELSHVANGDLRVMSFADLVSRVTGVLSLFGQLLLLLSVPLLLLGESALPLIPLLVLVAAPWLSAAIQLALSRSRELEADRRAVELTGDPDGLASALAKLERTQRAVWERVLIPGRREPGPSLLRTHPPTAERIARLMQLVAEPGGNARYGFPPAMLGPIHPAELPHRIPRHRPRWHLSGLWY